MRIYKGLGFLLTLVAVSAVNATLSAAIIVQYNAANTGVYTMAPVTVAPEVTGDNMVAGLGSAGNGLTAQGASTTWNFNGWNTASTSFAAAVAANDFWSWGFDVTTPNAEIDLTDLDIRLDRSGTGPDDFEIQVSVNGDTPVSVLTHNYNDSADGVNFLNVDLSALPTLVTGDSVVFTLGAYNSEAAGGTFDLENITFPGGTDGAVVNGNIVIVPEPATAALLLLAGAGMLGLRRSGR